MASWDACTMDPHPWMRFVECHPGFAGYVQAAGVILTVAGAIFGPPVKAAYDRWTFRRLRKHNARAYALAMLPKVNWLLEEIRQRTERLQRVTPSCQNSWDDFVRPMGIAIPMQLEISNLSVEDIDVESLVFIQGLVEVLREWNTNTFKHMEASATRTEDDWAAMVGDLRQRIVILGDLARDVRLKIYGIKPTKWWYRFLCRAPALQTEGRG